MSQRQVTRISTSLMTSVGPLSVAQPLPSDTVNYADPFVLLHHAGPQTIVAGAEEHRIDPHPHRGFAPVTFVYRGAVLHRDSLGNESIVGPGEVQWINAASGIVHSEGPAPDLRKTGGALELIQLWVNLPAAHKMDPPSYQELSSPLIPVVRHQGVTLRVVAGTLEAEAGPAVTQSPVTAIMAELETESSYQWADDDETALVYVLGGTIRVDDTTVRSRELAILGPGTVVSIAAVEGSGTNSSEPISLLLLAGQPLREPLATGGPFVMNTRLEIYNAFMDFQEGKMGTLQD